MARRSHVTIIVEGKDVSTQLAPYLATFSYMDSLEGKADVAEVELHDVEKIWMSDWFPQRGSSAYLSIAKEDWNGDGTIETLNLGTFEIDEIQSAYPPLTCKIKLNSVSNGAKVRGVDKFRSWEKTNIRQIASDIASEAGLALYFDAEDFQLERVEQSQESSLALLKKLCSDNGLILKVSDNTLIIVDAMKYEARPATAALTYGESAIKSFTATATVSKIYGDTNVYFKGSGAKDFILGFFELFTGKSGVKVRSIGKGLTRGSGDVVRVINRKVSSQAEAARLARAKLRETNKEEIKIEFELIGSFEFMAGVVVQLNGFGVFSGRMIIDEAAHKIDADGYTVRIRGHRCLEGY